MTRGSELRTKGMRWHVLPALRKHGVEADYLFGKDGLRLGEWLAGGQAGILKHGTHRTVYRVRLPHLDFIVKWFPGNGRRVSSLARGSEARREFDRAIAVAARAVPTVEPLAVGEGRRGASCLLLRTIAGAQPLGSFLEWVLNDMDGDTSCRMRFQLAETLGRFVAQMHDAGVTHNDLHPGNLLLDLDGDVPRIYLADLQGVHLGPPLGWRPCLQNLVMLNRWFVLRAGRADRLRFWHAYRAARRTTGWADGCVLVRKHDNPGRARHIDPLTWLAVRELERRTLASNLRFWHAQDRRCLTSSRYYRKVTSAQAAGHVVADLDADTVADFLADPDAAFQQPGAVVLKDSRSSTVVELERKVNGRLRPVIYKRFAVTAWTDPFVALVRQTPALRSYLLGHGMRLRGLPTPRPLGVWHRYRAGLPHEGYLLTEKVPDALDLAAFAGLLAKLSAPDRAVALRRAIDRVARLIGQLHERRLSHRDLKAANILMSSATWSLARSEQERREGAMHTTEVNPAGPVALQSVEPWFIDLVGVGRVRKLTRGRRVQNLARLNVSFLGNPGVTRADRLRFLRVYLKWGLRGRFGWKRWWRQIARATAIKVKQNLRNGRPLG